jgi:uncharacterized OsmC-like protein
MLAKQSKVVLIMAMVALLIGPAAIAVFADQHEGSAATYIINAGEQHWFTLRTQSEGAEVTVAMNVHPDGGASFQVATQEAVQNWLAGEDLQAVGSGTEDGTADLSWTGNLGPAGDYHLIVEYAGNGQDPSQYDFAVSGATYSADGDYATEGAAAEQPAAEEAAPTEAAAAPAPAAAAGLSTASATAQITNQPGRAIVSARGNHFVVDSIPPLGGPNEERNPMDVLLGAQSTCATFIFETAAQELGIPLNAISATVEADLNPAGIKDGSVNPRIQAMRIHFDLDGPTDEQAEQLKQQMMVRCPLYTTLERSMPIEVTYGEKPEADVAEGLSTASAVATLTNQPGRAIVSARGNHFVVDSIPPLGGPNEERNPMDLLLAAQSTCAGFIYETAAQELGYPVTDIQATVEADLNPAGIRDGASNPRIQAMRINMDLAGVTVEQAEELQAQMQVRCPLYTTMSRSLPIEVTNTIR